MDGLLSSYSLAFLGFITTLFADFAKMFGCIIGLKESLNAITFVILGTSIPDTLASRAAAINEEIADVAIGHVFGANSIKIFLGLGLP